MKHIILSIVFVLTFSSLNLMAQGTIIGVINADQIIQASEKGQAFLKEIERFHQTKKNELEDLMTYVYNLQKDARDNAASLSEEKLHEISILIQEKQTEIKRKQDDAERESQLKLNEGIERFEKELTPLINQIAKEKGIDLVLNNNSSNGIMFVSDRIDITQDVIARYNAMH